MPSIAPNPQSESSLQLVQEKLGKPYFDFEFLLECLQEVLIENGDEALLPDLPWRNSPEQQREPFSPKHIQMYCKRHGNHTYSAIV